MHAVCNVFPHTPFRPSALQWYRNTPALTASSVHVLLLPDATLPDKALDGQACVEVKVVYLLSFVYKSNFERIALVHYNNNK
jgi:hypothetical protein